MAPEKQFFTTDDYAIIDISEKAYDNQFFSFPGTFIQYTSESSGEINIALGSGGAGPPKDITLYPGGKVELKDKGRPFSGFFLTCLALPSAKILVANSGVEITPSPARITQIGEVGRIQQPVHIAGAIGAGLQSPVEPGSLTNADGSLVAGKIIKLAGGSVPRDFSNWGNLPADKYRIDNNRKRLGDAGTPLFTLNISVAARQAGKLYPAVAGDIIYILEAGFLVSEWQGPYKANSGSFWDLASQDVPAFPAGASVSIEDAGTRYFPSTVFEATQGPGFEPTGGSSAPDHLAVPFELGTRAQAYAVSGYERPALKISMLNLAHICKGSAVSLGLRLPFLEKFFAVGGNGLPTQNYFRRADSNHGSSTNADWFKPAISYWVNAVLLKKGQDF